MAALALVTFLRPDPQILGREIAQRYPHPDRQVGPGRGLPRLLRDPGILAAVAATVIANAVMVMLMGITALHMKIAGIGLGGISAERGRMQGLNDLSMSGVAASASLGGGLLFAAAGYGATGLIGAGASVLLPVLAVGIGRRGRVHPAT